MNQENKQGQANATNYLTTQNLGKIQEKTELQRIVTSLLA
jgi:hypothetical protein